MTFPRIDGYSIVFRRSKGSSKKMTSARPPIPVEKMPWAESVGSTERLLLLTRKA